METARDGGIGGAGGGEFSGRLEGVSYRFAEDVVVANDGGNGGAGGIVDDAVEINGAGVVSKE